MDYEMEELIPIVAKLAETYTGCDSTSMTYEKAEMLMSGVLYCLNEYKNQNETGLTDKCLPAAEQYRIGAQIVLEKAKEVRTIYHEIIPYFDDYQVECLRETVLKGIPEFLKWYDAKYFPQNTVLKGDYPLLINCPSVSGVDAVHAYICAIKIEQRFLSQFERSYIVELLNRAIPDYTQMFDNVCRIVLLNTIGHAVLRKPLKEIGFSTMEYDRLWNIFQFDSVEDIEKVIYDILNKMTGQFDKEIPGTRRYFEYAVKDMAVCIDTAVKTKQLDKIFVL